MPDTQRQQTSSISFKLYMSEILKTKILLISSSSSEKWYSKQIYSPDVYIKLLNKGKILEADSFSKMKEGFSHKHIFLYFFLRSYTLPKGDEN